MRGPRPDGYGCIHKGCAQYGRMPATCGHARPMFADSTAVAWLREWAAEYGEYSEPWELLTDLADSLETGGSRG